ncbi:MAG: MBL fold metallo-hydrolase [Sandaracinaceae bacterium]|nr:MBL fold metallo-hydrolase [Sandaracinaceae bacterium]
MRVQEFFDTRTFTLTYVVFDETSKDAVIIDPVLDFDASRAETSTDSLDRVFAFVESQSLRVHYVLETHAHADHITGAQPLKERLNAKIAIGARISEVQKIFVPLFDLSADVSTEGEQFDRLLTNGEKFDAGSLAIEVIATPGHTPACVTYKIADAVFTGDALFIEDYGTGRCDFPGGSADVLYTSVHEGLYTLADETRVFVGHDYQPGQRALRFMTTIGESKRANIHIKTETKRTDFVRFRNERDATLSAPALILQSIQLNVNAGCLSTPHSNGRRYLTIPLNLFKPNA